MFGLGAPEIVVILVVALIVLGPQKLPELAKQLGRFAHEMRHVADDVRRQFDESNEAPPPPPAPPPTDVVPQPKAPPPPPDVVPQPKASPPGGSPDA